MSQELLGKNLVQSDKPKNYSVYCTTQNMTPKTSWRKFSDVEGGEGFFCESTTM